MRMENRQNSEGNMSVIYLWKFHRFFVGEFIGNPSVIGDHFHRYFVDIRSVIFYEYTL